MVKANNGSIVATIIICTVLLGLFTLAIIPEAPVVPTAEEIAALVVVNVTAPVDNSAVLDEILDQVDKRTDVSKKDKNNAIDYAEDELSNRDLKKLLEDVLGIDKDDFDVISVDVKDKEVTTESEDDNDAGNFCVKQFIRIEYQDVDESESDIVYVVLTADIVDLYDDENDQEVEYSIEEVSRSFEFD